MGPEFLVVVGLLGCGGTAMDQQIPINRGRGYTQSIDTLGLESAVPASPQKSWGVLTTVRPRSDGGASLFTFVLGVGLDGASSTNRRWCYSRGALEERIRTGVETKAGL